MDLSYSDLNNSIIYTVTKALTSNSIRKFQAKVIKVVVQFSETHDLREREVKNLLAEVITLFKTFFDTYTKPRLKWSGSFLNKVF